MSMHSNRHDVHDPRQAQRSAGRRSRVGAALLAGAALSLAGCYERVIEASGPGADTVNVQPSERSNTWLDRAVFQDKGREESAFGSSTADRQKAYMRQNRGGN